MEDELFNVLLKMINVQNYPSVPYDIYRYYTLLEDLDKKHDLVFNGDQKEESDFNFLSYDQIDQLNFSQILGTQPSKKMKKVIRIIDDEAIEVAHYLINKTFLSKTHLAIKTDMMAFIVNNADGIRLYIRDITTMVYTIFVFLSLRRMSAPMKTEVLFKLNQKIKGKIRPLPSGASSGKESEEEMKDSEDLKWVLWGKDNKHGQFLIVEKREGRETPGIKCMNKRIPEIELLLDKEQVRDEYNVYFNTILKNKKFSGKRGKKKIMCEFLKQHLIKNKRYNT